MRKYSAKQKRSIWGVFLLVLGVIASTAVINLVGKASPALASKIDDLKEKTNDLIQTK